MREVERRVMLSVLDRKWREHLYEMDYLQEGIGLRAMAQKDPLVEYQREGFDMFTAMMEGIKEESVGYLFNLEVQVEQQVEEVPVEDAKPSMEKGPQDAVPAQAGSRPEIRAKGLEAPQRRNLHLTAPTVDGAGGTIELAHGNVNIGVDGIGALDGFGGIAGDLDGCTVMSRQPPGMVDDVGRWLKGIRGSDGDADAHGGT